MRTNEAKLGIMVEAEDDRVWQYAGTIAVFCSSFRNLCAIVALLHAFSKISSLALMAHTLSALVDS